MSESSAATNGGATGGATQNPSVPQPSLPAGTGAGATNGASQQPISEPLQRWKKQGPMEEPYNSSLPRGN